MTLAYCILDAAGRLLWHTSPALIAVIGGALLIQRYHVKRANLGSIVDSAIKDLELLQSDAFKYWNSPKKKKKNAELLAQKIKSSLKKITVKVYILVDENEQKRSEPLKTVLVNLHDKVTGGDFESNNRKPDASRYFEVTNAINSTMSVLLRIKI